MFVWLCISCIYRTCGFYSANLRHLVCITNTVRLAYARTCVFQLFACVKNRSGENKNVHGCDCKQVYIEIFLFLSVSCYRFSLIQFIHIIRRFHWHGTDDREKLLCGVSYFCFLWSLKPEWRWWRYCPKSRVVTIRTACTDRQPVDVVTSSGWFLPFILRSCKWTTVSLCGSALTLCRDLAVDPLNNLLSWNLLLGNLGTRG